MTRRWFVLIAVLAVGAKLGVAASWDLLADEAYHWTWSDQLAFGYFDQPPWIAWVLAIVRFLGGDSALALRLPGIVAVGAAALALEPWAEDRFVWGAWWFALPPLFVLTNLAVPDAWLLAFWAFAIAAALRGGRAWLLAGLFAGLASLTKYTGVLLIPCLLLALDRSERRTLWPWLGLLVAATLLTPNLIWNGTNDFVTLRFQVGEGLLSPHAPGWGGPIRVLLDQTLIVGPLAALAIAAWCAGARTFGREDRLLAAASLPVLSFFWVASVGGPPEAHWPAPAWVGVGLALSRSSGRALTLARVAAWLGLLTTTLLVIHTFRPLVRTPADPATRLTEGRVLAGELARWALPEGTPIVTERYQEAALIRWHLRLPARVLPGCGRASQYDRTDYEPPSRALFVRPSRSGPPTCAAVRFTDLSSGHEIRTVDPAGRRVGPWQVFEAQGPREP